jgi:integrin alpha FG-GAP repeat containing protein 1
MVSIGSDQQTLTIHLWDHGEHHRRHLLISLVCDLLELNKEQFKYRTSTVLKHNQRIVNVVPGDFTQSGRLDLLVMSQSSSKGQLDLSLYRAAVGGGLGEILDDFTSSRRPVTVPVETTPVSLPPSLESQPIPFDSTGDLRIDLLGISPPSSGEQGPFSVWQNVWNASEPNSAVYELCVRDHVC